jgi:serine/threonine protein kinase
MELLEGIDLRALVQRFGPVPPARAVYLLQQACEWLAEAHRAGVVHRDIKPSNLMACHVGDWVDFVKVLDFGLVRRLERRDDELESDSDVVLGTPAYMAPEQVTAPARVDSRADIYALGCVAYWLLSGRLVFERSTVEGTMVDHMRAQPLGLREVADQPVPRPLERLILECLAKDPDQRPQTVDELIDRLGEIDVGIPWDQEQAHGWWLDRLRELLGEEETHTSSSSSGEFVFAWERKQAGQTKGRLSSSTDALPHQSSWPRAAVSEISEVRIRARQLQYAREREGSRASAGSEASDVRELTDSSGWTLLSEIPIGAP